MTAVEASERFGLFTKEDAPVPLTGVAVNGAITGRTARVTLRQRFENRESSAIEAVYKFPLPEGSSVCGFTVAVGDRILRGRVEEREKAFVEYDDALAQGHGAFLLDMERPNIFTLSVGNVKPRHVVDIEISYVTMLDTIGAGVRFMLPTTISPRYLPAGMPDRGGIPVDTLINPVLRLDVPYGLRLHLDIVGKQDIAGIECPSHSIRTSYAEDAVAVEFSSDTVKMDHDFVLTITYQHGFKNRAYSYTDGKHTYVQLDLTPDLSTENGFVRDGAPYSRKTLPSEIIFLLDCSGSMGGPSIAQAKKALEVFLRGLTPGTRFNLYRFGSSFSSLWPGSVDYSEANLKTALLHLEGVRADLGGTELLAPMTEIYGHPPDAETRRNIILITDGQVGNESDVLALAKADELTRVFTVGIGFGPNEYLTKRLASLTGGATELVSPGERIEPKVLRLFAKAMSEPIDIDINWGATVEQAPARAVVHDKECVSVFVRIPAGVPLPTQLTVEGSRPSSTGTWTVPVTQLTAADAALPLFWARAHISDLEEGVTPEGGSRQSERRGSSVESQLVALSKQYGILSRSTSFITVEYRSDAEKSTGEIELRKVPSMLTRGWGGIAHLAFAMTPDASVSEFRHMLDTSAPAAPSAGATPALYRRIADADADSRPLRHMLPRRPTPPESFAARVDLLPDILALQTAGGGFELPDARLVLHLGLDLTRLREVAGRMQGGGSDPLKLVCTAVVLALLQQRFAQRQAEWLAVTEKSRQWLHAELQRLQSTVDAEPLEVWATEYVRSTGHNA
ncbi:MAG: VWA domain-containing protein [Dehalococcoidia bacterium]|nr:VWA domain-containing protein [Dehalococcoidia bacterium]